MVEPVDVLGCGHLDVSDGLLQPPLGRITGLRMHSGKSVRDSEDGSSTGILLTPERPITRNGGTAETVTDVPYEGTPRGYAARAPAARVRHHCCAR